MTEEEFDKAMKAHPGGEAWFHRHRLEAVRRAYCGPDGRTAARSVYAEWCSLTSEQLDRTLDTIINKALGEGR